MKKIQLAFLGVMMCCGLVALGFFIDKGLQSFSNKERIVTVKGLSEKNIKAVKAEIIIGTRFSGSVPKDVVANVNHRMTKLSNYLKEKKHDFNTSDLYFDDTKTDYEYDWIDGKRIQIKKDRYIATKNIVITSNDVENAEKTAHAIELDLINQSLSSDINVSYTFPELNDIKPDLIAESTKNARITGEQFARDSHSKLGKIKTASQGQISIVGRGYYYDDETISNAPKEPYLQKVRVISTIVFFLED